MDLQGLATYMSGLGSAAVLAASDTRLPQELRDRLATMPGGRIDLSACQAVLAGPVLTITGTTGDVWPVQGMPGLEITLARVTLTLTNWATPPVTASLGGTLPLGTSVAAPVTLTARADSGWDAALDTDVSGVSPESLLLLGRPGEQSPFPVPPGLEPFAAGATIPADGFLLTFYPGTDFEAQVAFTVPLPGARWTVVPSILELDGVEVRAAMSTLTLSVLLAAQIEVDGVPLEFGVGMRPDSRWIAYVKAPRDGTLPGLAALAAWIGGPDTTAALSGAGFDPGAFDLAIEAVQVVFDWQAARLDTLRITSRLTLGELDLDVVLSLPDVSLTGSLHGAEPVPLAPMLTSWSLPGTGVPDTLKITEVRFSAQPGHQTYLAELTLDDVWRAGPISLTEVGVVGGYSPAGGLSGGIHCVLELGPSIRLSLAGRYDAAAGGWTFEGSTGQGTRLEIGDLLAELASTFGVTDVPDALSSLALSELAVTYQSATSTFTFTCTGDARVAEVPVRLRVDVGVSADPSRAATFTGTLTVPVTTDRGTTSLRFEAHFAKDATGGRFAASYSRAARDPAPDVRSLVAAFSPSAADLIPEGVTVDVRAVLYATGRGFSVFAADLGATVDFAGLPVVGDHLAGLSMGVDPVRIMVASAPVTAAEVTAVNALLPNGVAKLPERDIPAGFAIDATLKLGDLRQPLALPVAAASATAGPPSRAAVVSPTQAQTSDGASWLKVQRAFGPVQIERIGLAFRKGDAPKVAVLLDASITVAGLTLSLAGLSAELSLADLAAVPAFGLDGLGLSYASGPVKVGGAFLVGEIVYQGHPYRAYSGEAQIQTETFGLAAIGSYAQLPEGPSLFVYAYLDYPLGGPPVFFVRGLAAGFGYNRRLVPPAIDGVAAFPLIAEATGGRPPGTTLAGELAALAGYLPPSIGDCFLAVGVRFTSFQMIDSFVLLAVVFGHRFEVDVLGLSTLVLPAPDAASAGVTPIAEVQLALRATFVPEDGFLSVAAQLTRNSFLLSRDCHLTGGFAFSTWFAGEHNGDFVVTVGGYHPHFPVPAHYPAVPRLGFSWQVTPQLSLSGTGYFALTPGALMAGGSLHAAYQDDTLRAWFDLTMDLLVAWQPYHYEADLRVNVGAVVGLSGFGTDTISVQGSADLSIRGPEFSGTATVDLSVVSFTIAFGAGGSGGPTPVPWSQFQAAMLPAREEILTVGLRGDTQQDGADLGVADPAGLVLITDSAIPAMAASRGSPGVALPVDGATTALGVGPVGVAAGEMTSAYRIMISREGVAADDDFVFAPIRKNLPFALWGGRLRPAATDPRLVENALTGYTIRPRPPATPDDPPWLDRAALQAATALYIEAGAIHLNPPTPTATSDADARTRADKIMAAVADDAVALARSMAAEAVLPDAEIDLYGFDTTQFHEIPQVMLV